MTTFRDGPAAGWSFLLRHSSAFLRVVTDGKGFDALDAPGDQPKITEKIYAYRLVKENGTVHIRAAKGRSGFYRMAEYQFVAVQPSEDVMRSQRLWDQWCVEQRSQSDA